MRTSAAALVIAVSQSVIASSPQGSSAKAYVKRTYGPAAVGRSALGATVAQGTDTPQEWGRGALGFGKRFASAFGQHIIKKSIEYPVAKLRHEPFGYRPSEKNGFKSRLLYALTSVVITHKTTDGSKTVHSAELSGDFGSGLLSRLWQPASTRTLAAGFGAGGTVLAADAGYNVLREFWPEIRHPHSHGAAHAALLEKMKLERIKSKSPGHPVLAARPEDIEPYDAIVTEPDRDDD